MKLLLVEDDRIVRIPVRDALQDVAFTVTDIADGAAALRRIEQETFDIVLTDVRLPGLSGIELFRRLRQVQPSTAVVLMTAYANTDDAVAVMREGARDYLAKPFEIDELLIRLGRVRHDLEFRRRMEAGTADSSRHPHAIRGTAPATKRLLSLLAAAAASDVNVLITGETGTGKELAARTIHASGKRASKPFVAVNCAAIPDTLFEAELFGHERGAFTGADRRRVGRIEAAQGGCLFLDEVGDISLGSQVKLLRVIDTGSFESLGSSRSVVADVRVICATNRDLRGAMDRGEFRQDLFYRLNVLDIQTPPLRERRTDIPLLVSDFLREIAARQGRPVPALDPTAVAALATHDYPGNVRELLHALERAVAMAMGGVIGAEHLPPEMISALPMAAEGGPAIEADEVEPLAGAIERFERQYIQRVLEKVDGHRGKAAALLGISRKSLWERLRSG